MPNYVDGGGDARPTAPGVPADTEATYKLPVPKDTEVANVPADMTTLATEIKVQLDKRLTEDSAERAYQKKIVVRTTRPTNPAEYPDGTIIFVVGG